MKRTFALLVVATVSCGGRPAATKISDEATETDPKWEACKLIASDGELEGECGTLVVPELRSVPTSTPLRLPLQRIRATKQMGVIPIVYFGDGPGASSYQFRPSMALAAAHDLLIVGMRGVEGSRALDCPEIGKAFAGSGALTPPWQQAVEAAFDACITRIHGDRVELTGYGVREIAADVERARELAGYQRMHLLADGFGAIVARVYAQLYPEHVERMVFLGPTPAHLPVSPPANAVRALIAYEDVCRAEPACAEHAVDVVATIRDITLPARWLIYPIDRGRLLLATALQLGYRRGAMLNLGAWQDAAHGDMAGIGQVSWGTDIILGSGFVWGASALTLASVSSLAALQAEPDNDPPALSAIVPDDLLPSSTIVTYLASLAAKARELPRFPELPSDPPQQPTLVVHGDLDPRYAPEELRAAMDKELARVSFVAVHGYGIPSELWAVAPDLLVRTITGFLEGHDADNELSPPLAPVNTPRMATMAKLVVTAMAAFPVLGLVIGWLLLRRLRRAIRKDAARRALPT